MIRRDCIHYHCEHDMGASIDCCTLKKELGNCPCTFNCEKYINKNYVFKLGLNELQKINNAEKFKQTFGLYATEIWAMPESDFLVWLNADYEIKKSSEE